MTEESLISTTVNYEREGRQFGHLAVPRSTNSAGWANYFLPLAVIRNGNGPTAVLTAGNHGDEYEGPVALMKLARRLEPENIRGRIIIVPMLNRPAVTAGTRLSPLDGANMNRAFPGRHDGTITSQIAHYVSRHLLPLADLVVDVHSGGSSLHMVPSVNMHRVADAAQMERMLAAGRAWGAPYIFIYRDVAGAGLLPGYAESLGKVTLGTEMGSKAQFGPEIVSLTERGVANVLRWAEILQDGPDDFPVADTLVVEASDVDDYLMAPVSGIYESFFELGDSVQAGVVVGQLHDMERPFREPETVIARTDGLVVARRSNPLTAQGECVAVVARPTE
jgi:predicted deacylase